MAYKDKVKQSEYYKKWYAENGRNRSIDYLEATIDWHKKHPYAKAIHMKVKRAIASGKLLKPINCESCSNESKLSGHHNDYSKPLDVQWLCSSCHKILHNKL